MVDEVASQVLADNYNQTLALSLEQMDAVGELEPHAQFMARLEHEGRLDRVVEGLPDPIAIAERAKAGLGLTRPELAVIMAYGKLELSRDIVDSPAPEDPFFEATLEGYFPKPLRRYDEAIRKHRLRREIIATAIANDLVNRCGPTFPSRLQAAAACDTAALVSGYEAAKTVLDLPALWNAVAALDGKVPAAGQMALFRRLAAILRGTTFWLARRAWREKLPVTALVQRYGAGLKSLRKLTPDILSPVERAAYEARADKLTEAGAPRDLACQVSALQPLSTAADLVDLAEASSWPLAPVARLYHEAGAAFAFDRLRAAAGGFSAGDAFERTAVRRLIEDLLAEQAALTRAVMAFAGSAQSGETAASAASTVASWAALRPELTAAARRTIEEIEQAGGDWTFAKLTIANAALRELAADGPRKKR
jgi:glutamate dehydrogenase